MSKQARKHMQMWEWVLLEGILVLEVILAGMWRVLALKDT
jgi:hypothetical protein